MGELVSAAREVVIEIGAMPIRVRTDSPDFARLLEDRYGGFVTANGGRPDFELDVVLAEPRRARTRRNPSACASSQGAG